MKRIFLFLILLCCFMQLMAQESSWSYVRIRTMLNTSGNSFLDDVSYYDGLGRLYQTTQRGITPSRQNLISLQEYDESGRDSKNWLPVASASEYLSPASFASVAPGNYGGDSRPYSQSVYETSPLNRVAKQYGAGAAWYSAHGVTIDYLANSSLRPCIYYSVSSTGALVKGSPYPIAQLYVSQMTDEDGNIAYTFTDKLERVVLNRQMKDGIGYDTYYVYDDFGNLCFVLQPKYQDSEDLALYAFQYKYDIRNRCIEKKLPGVQPVKYYYDKADKLILAQDGRQSGLQYTFYLYDNLGRLTVQGVCSNTVSDAATIASMVVGCTRVNSNSGIGSSGYNSEFALKSPVVHKVNYYDDYDFRTLTGFNNASFPVSSNSGKGLLTGSVSTVLESGVKLYYATYYDNEGRVSKTVQSNLLGGYETTSTIYTFSGKPSIVTHTHTATGKTTRTEVYNYTYDHADRVSKVEHTLNGTKITLADNTYDNQGRLYSKSLHGSAINKLTYAYNIRSWLTGITGTNFTQNLYYTDGVNTTKCYNGNISSMTWKGGDNVVRGYKYAYDGLSRLATASYGETAAINTNLDRFTEKVSGYDKNGNITALQRYGQITASAYGLIDNLSFTLSGNQLNRVDDAVTTAAYNNGFEFKDAVKQAGEYTYDANGNLTKDLNKGISSIQYNVLNLPSSITFGDGSTITYTYGADGTKLRTVHKIGSTPTTTDYCSNVIYENGSPKQLLTEEGYVSLSDNKYHYYLKDHQGNNRVVINQTGAVEETNHYYPFGGVYAGTGNVQPYKYNGKELDTKKGLNWYDYGARQYDAAIGRWHVVDPSSEKYFQYSPYNYCKNNPVLRIDVDGKDDYTVNQKGFVYLARTTKYNYDRVYYHDGEKGTKQPIGKFATIADRKFLPDMVEYQKKAIGTTTFGATANLNDATGFFKFAADNSTVEWKLDAYKNGDNATFVIVSNHYKNMVEGGSKAKKSTNTQGSKVVDIHSHPSNESKGASETDRNSISGKNNAVYLRRNGTLHTYDSKNSSISTINISTAEDLQKYIKDMLEK